jgi:hypothetical protein
VQTRRGYTRRSTASMRSRQSDSAPSWARMA